MKTNFEQLDNYSRHLLSKEDASSFESMLAQDENLKAELDVHASINQLAKDFGYIDLEKNIKADLAKWRVEDQRKEVFKKAAIISIITASIVSLLYVWLNPKSVLVEKNKKVDDKPAVLSTVVADQKIVAPITEQKEVKSIQKDAKVPNRNLNSKTESTQTFQSEPIAQTNLKTLEVPVASAVTEHAQTISSAPNVTETKHAPMVEKQATKPTVTHLNEVAEPAKKNVKKEYVVQPNLGEAFVPEIEEHQAGWLTIKNKSGIEIFKIHFSNKETAKWEPQNNIDVGQYLFEIRFDEGQTLYGYVSILQ